MPSRGGLSVYRLRGQLMTDLVITNLEYSVMICRMTEVSSNDIIQNIL